MLYLDAMLVARDMEMNTANAVTKFVEHIVS